MKRLAAVALGLILVTALMAGCTRVPALTDEQAAKQGYADGYADGYESGYEYTSGNPIQYSDDTFNAQLDDAYRAPYGDAYDQGSEDGRKDGLKAALAAFCAVNPDARECVPGYEPQAPWPE